jgi:hypothetical protein
MQSSNLFLLGAVLAVVAVNALLDRLAPAIARAFRPWAGSTANKAAPAQPLDCPDPSRRSPCTT